MISNPQQDAIRQEMIEAAKRGKVEPRADPVREFSEGEFWACMNCRQDKFGKVQDGNLHIKFKQREVNVQTSEGRVSVRCRFCGTLNVLNMSVINVKIEVEGEPEATEPAIEMANENGIHLGLVKGTGKDGKITTSDVRAAIKQRDDEETAKVVSVRTFSREPVTEAGMPLAEVQNQPLPPGADEEPVEIDEE